MTQAFSTQTSTAQSVIDPALLKILACPVALTMTSKSKNPGRLLLYKNSWLISEVSGHKYPIIDGVPIMLIDVGKKWKNTPKSKLPIPAPRP